MRDEHRLRIEMLPVAYGDALLVEYGSEPVRRVLIDAGPQHTYDDAVRSRLLALPDAQRAFELLVVTHIDSDHIDGAVMVMQDPALGMSFRDVWFNGWRHIATAPTFGPHQGEWLGALLDPERWNTAFGGDTIVVPPDGPLPCVELAGGLRLTVVSPGPDQLDDLRREWVRVLSDAGVEPGDHQAALERLSRRPQFTPSPTFARPLTRDNSEANGSSIALVAELGPWCVLLTGDAFAPVLAANLRRLAVERGVERMRFDAVKLAHHGSRQNVSADLLAAMDCRRFLVSTNGDKFRHPDAEAIELILDTIPNAELRFNATSDTTTPFAAHGVYPDHGGHVLDLIGDEIPACLCVESRSPGSLGAQLSHPPTTS
jgi:hypothetical protein